MKNTYTLHMRHTHKKNTCFHLSVDYFNLKNCLIVNLMNSDAFHDSECFKSFKKRLYAEYILVPFELYCVYFLCLCVGVSCV